ncbi:DUF4235 domain-containing protein [Yimella sp. RIT 621]|uniref:DUF4235 domain-containing protein n=1 Tax=Yimella sp. RIT 621 TaxID=2510323 RepID=UPI00145A018B|nr:DUF4235 domain-containing protein [Yimella sp. RIT 621]
MTAADLEELMGSVVWKIVAAAAGVAATQIANKVTNQGWHAVTGQPAPVGKHDPNYSAKETALFVLVAAAVAQGVRALGERKAADFWTKTAGHPPQVVVKEHQKALEKATKKAAKKA